MAKKQKVLEKHVLKAVNEYLYIMMKTGRGVWWRVNNGGIYDAKIGGYRKQTSKLAYKGISDIMGIYNGVFYAIEVKGSSGDTSSEQIAFGQQILESGGRFMIVNDVTQLYDIFT